MQNKKSSTRKRPKSNLIRIKDVIPDVKENLGIENTFKIIQLREIWPLITSFKTAEKSLPAYFDKNGNLVIAVKNPALATELSMEKTGILDKLKEAVKGRNISFKDIRFIVRS